MNNLTFKSSKDFIFFLKDKNFKKIFIIAGEKSYKLSGASKLIDELLINKNVRYFFKKSSYPDLVELKKIIKEINLFTPDLIIAVGGGSVLDYAKIANVLTDSQNLEHEIPNSSYKIKNKFTKLVAIPTTAGSGAEVTSNAVIYIDKIKYSVEGELLKPDFFFLIPELVIGASNKIKASAGFDAIAQAIESLISKKSNSESLNFAQKSLQISLKYYLDFLNNPNKDNTSAMCLAANLSGKAISISKTTAPHAVSYPFTSIFNISHGHAVSLTLSKFLFFNYNNIRLSNCNFNLKDRFKIIFDLTKTSNINDLKNYIDKLTEKAKLENKFDKLGININNSVDKILSDVNEQRLSNNPIKIEKKIIRSILLT